MVELIVSKETAENIMLSALINGVESVLNILRAK